MIKVSIISCFYNEEQYVDRLLDSIPRRDDIEVLARDDASTDGTYAKLLAYQEAHPELLHPCRLVLEILDTGVHLLVIVVAANINNDRRALH